MHSITRHVMVVAGFALLLHVSPAWGQPVLNPTGSDSKSNTAGGTDALRTCLGFAGLGPCVGNDNTAFGYGTLNANTNGNNNTAVGFFALDANISANDNTAIGTSALQATRTGSGNTATGSLALADNDTGSLNTATGYLALFSNNGGSDNTAIGAKALKKSLGTKNIGIGFQAGVSLVNGNNNIYIGNQGAGDESQTIRIGTAQTRTFIAGIGNAGVAGATVEVDTATGQLGIATSSVRYKRNIVAMGTTSEGMLKLRL